LIRALEKAVGDPDFFEKIPWPPPFRFRFDNDRFAFFADKHFRSIEPIILWKPDRLRAAGRKEFRCGHVDTVSIRAT
jgi:hypothetical protein